MKKIKSKLILLTLLMLILINTSFALNVKSEEGKFQITMPDVVSRTQPVEIKVQAKKIDANFIKLKGDCILLEGDIPEEDKKMLPPIGTRAYTSYNKEKEFSLKVGIIPFKDSNERTCELDFIKRKNKDDSFTFARAVDEISFNFKVSDVNVMHDVPIELSETSNPDELNIRAATPSNPRFNIGISAKTYPYGWDYLNPDYDPLWDKMELRWKDYEETTTQGMKTYYFLDHSNSKKSSYSSEDEDLNYVHAEMSALRFYPHFYIKFELEKEDDVPSEEGAATEQAYIDEFMKIMENLQISESGVSSNTDDFMDDEEIEGCIEDSDCGNAELVCTACGKCKDEKEVYDVEDVEIEIELNNELSSKSIQNTVHNRVKIVTSIEPTFKVEKKEIGYCDIKAPGLEDYKLIGEVKEGFEFAGFTTGIKIFEERTKDFDWNIDFTKKPLKYPFLISPNDHKKIHGAIGDINNKIEIRVENKGNEIAQVEEDITLKPINYDVEFSSAGQQLQDDSNKLVKFNVKNPNAKQILLKLSLIGPGEIEFDKYTAKKAFGNIKPGSEQKIMYYAPKLGNFDIGKELASLSMVDLQVEAAKQIAEDTALAYSGEFMQNIEDAYSVGKVTKTEKAGVEALKKYFKRNPGKYDPSKALKYIKELNAAQSEAENLDLLAKAFKLYKGTYGLSKMPKGTVDLSEDIKNAAGGETNTNKKTWTETGAEYGVTGINILQTGVGVLTFIPNKIPLLGDASAALQSSFSAATNIWKANLKYIAKDEKIARAEEKFFPAIIILTAEDESGWQITKGYLLQVAYHEI